MSPWERFLYVCALAFWRAYFDVRLEARLVWKEPKTDADRQRIDRFRAAVQQLRRDKGGAGPDDPAPAG